AQAQALVLLCAGRTFVAGADIREFGKPLQPPTLQEIISVLEGLDKPAVAAIHGTAFGGGLELALACHYRCAVPGAQFGLPEVKLGLLPGAGGTQRLPRLIGLKPALEMITSGDPIGTAEALKLGLVHEQIAGDLQAGAVAFAKKIAAKRPLPLVRSLAAPAAESDLLAQARKETARRARGNQAPLRCLEAVAATTTLGFDEGLRKERELFLEAVGSEQSRALRYVFFAEREAAKIPDLPKDAQPRALARGAVLGAGTMGTGIAMNFANAGIPVTLSDTKSELVEKGLATIRKNYASTVSKGRLSQAEMDQRLALITPGTGVEACAQADVVIEAVFEEMGIKKEVFGQLDELCGPDALLATNTSTLDVNAIAAATRHPERVIGMHFFSPANVMRLCEVVRGSRSSAATIATAMDLARRMKKVGVLVGVCDGFVGNRMLHQYTREAAYLLEEGALPQQVDKVIYDFGLPMGPFAMGDLAGLDVGWRIRKGRAERGELHGRYAGSIADKLCEMGRFGQKTGAGYYKYEAGSRTPQPDPMVEDIIVKESARLGIPRRAISDEEILTRCLYPMINEGAKILQEGIAIRASDIDTIWINGYGFPAYRGGPMFYGDSVGLRRVYDTIVKYQQAHGDVWQPAALLKRLAEQGRGFLDS
ncbi:MAG TPA: 3-hydroxyacyl-CoA dehydrogenase NAD-binding domain-containing protein, partial [bacterium]|nr:3-hydroxyacyl-CoA dehydrogenase NAD-binding domain-containing protein [bacterium]